MHSSGYDDAAWATDADRKHFEEDFTAAVYKTELPSSACFPRPRSTRSYSAILSSASSACGNLRARSCSTFFQSRITPLEKPGALELEG